MGISSETEYVHVYLGNSFYSLFRRIHQVFLAAISLSDEISALFPEDPPGPLYPPCLPSERITLWHGTVIGFGLAAQALATALDDPGFRLKLRFLCMFWFDLRGYF